MYSLGHPVAVGALNGQGLDGQPTGEQAARHRLGVFVAQVHIFDADLEQQTHLYDSRIFRYGTVCRQKRKPYRTNLI